MSEDTGPRPRDFIKTVRIKGDRHNITFPARVMALLGVASEDHVTFYVGDHPDEVIVQRTSDVKGRGQSN